MLRNATLYLEQIIQSCEAIERYVQGVTAERFEKDSLLQDGVMIRVVSIGESASKLPVEAREKMVVVPWKKKILACAM